MTIKKEIREKVWLKYDKHCAYCGKEIEYKQMQVDHIEPRWHTVNEEDSKKYGITKGSDEFENFNPACVRCNKWKATFSVEGFRKEIEEQLNRLKRDSSNYRLALDYGMIKENNEPIVFYFEKVAT